MPATRHDLIIIGGGLAGGLAALALARGRPDLDLAIVEPGERIGGNHLWSFFESDVAPEDRWLVEQLIAHHWPAYEVRFPAYSRRIDQPYRTIESERLDVAVRKALPRAAIIRASAQAVEPNQVSLDDGRLLEAAAVIDARGLTGSPSGLSCGWQKFVGQSLSITGGHGLDAPIVMDAAVDQADGYRFVYALPFSPTQVFVEDTYYSGSSALDRDLLSGRIAAYAAARGWKIEGVSRDEAGVLPVVMGGDFDAFWPLSDPVARGGVRAGLFHPLTSYSIPDAVRFAIWLAREAPLGTGLGQATRELARRHWEGGSFDRLLARMLFKAADPPERYRVLERFYRLPPPLIARFYAGSSTWGDRIRILAGKPPVPIGRAVAAMMDRP